ncbi:hypothetical protein H7849_16425 [Alloacidobacterium dinghuense]|uniref:Uncharacterized protein n=1 Tax=Alloacidobacterium dinghuense TaxID=2763107 RepID=A0A7G8BDT6_9BACT|nr:hypothetical protein [Alloacidobacterium dinghuense]QNI30706.1 hypothetical protein H7849_16425 [Alloacidobacterium dinghuense]
MTTKSLKVSNRSMLAAATAILSLGYLAGGLASQAQDFDRDHDHDFHGFAHGSIVLSGTVYAGNADTVTPGEILPHGCLNTGAVTNPNPATVNVPLLPADQTPSTTTTAVTVTCGFASDNGEAPNLHDNHNVWNNASTDPNFGVSSPIVLWDLSTDGALLGALHVPGNEIVTSFSSKSELALNRSADGKSLTFMGYRGGPGCPTLTLDPATNTLTQGTNVGPISPTAPNLIDVSASSTPGLCDPTNPSVASYAGASNPTAYYRSIAEVDAWGHISYTDGDAYSGDNSRAVMKADNWLYYSVGNDNNGGLSKKQVPETQLGFNLSHSTGAELFTPGAAPLVPPDNNMISFFVFPGDKPGKDTNFRGMTIFNDTLYVAKGSGGNGINTVYQLGTPGVLPTTGNAPSGGLVNEPFTILPGFPDTSASTNSPGGDYPFGIWFANATTLYVCDEGDLIYTPNQVINGQVNVADAGTLATAGLQKWVLTTTASGSQTWVREYVIQNGLDLGAPYSVRNYPASIEPAAGGCRNIIGVVNHDGTATIYAITSTISQNGDNGADPNKLVKVADRISDTQPATNGHLDRFVTIRSARAGEAFRGVALAPSDDDHDR